MTPLHAGIARTMPDLISASLLTAGNRGEVHLMGRDGRVLKLKTDTATARSLAVSLWKALDRAD